MNKNLSVIHALLRITGGLTFLSLSTAKLSRCNCSILSGLFFIIAGSYSVATGIFRYCPMSVLVEKRMEQFTDESANDLH